MSWCRSHVEAENEAQCPSCKEIMENHMNLLAVRGCLEKRTDRLMNLAEREAAPLAC